jgi:nitrate reductase NapD
VVVLEAEHESRILDTINHIQQIPGVLNAALIYHELLSPEGEPE